MNRKTKQLLVRILCFVLAGLMILSTAATVLMILLG